jgi:hypothetical protein
MTHLGAAAICAARCGDRHLGRAKRCSCDYGDEPWAEGSARADAPATAGDRHDAPTSERMRELGESVDLTFTLPIQSVRYRGTGDSLFRI